jgi:hypothetical protein
MLAGELERLKFHPDGSGAEMAIPPSAGVPEWVKDFSELSRALREVSDWRKQPILNVMVNRLAPGITVPVHRDWIRPTRHQPDRPCVERWHLPILTNEECMVWVDEIGFDHYRLGVWSGPIQYWREHYVENTGATERVHLVVDLDTPVRQGWYAEQLAR